MGTMTGWKTRKANEAAERAGRDEAMKILGERSERARLSPLLERCEALALAQLHLHQRLPRPDAKAVALFENLVADLRRELGKEE